jgi:hypothetical protein
LRLHWSISISSSVYQEISIYQIEKPKKIFYYSASTYNPNLLVMAKKIAELFGFPKSSAGITHNSTIEQDNFSVMDIPVLSRSK